MIRSLPPLLPARVYFSPHQPGATYVATGRGYSTTGNPPQPVCEPVGAVTATLSRRGLTV